MSETTVDVRKLLAEALRARNCDGLIGDSCICTLDKLVECEEVPIDECIAGKRRECAHCPEHFTEEQADGSVEHYGELGHCGEVLADWGLAEGWCLLPVMDEAPKEVTR